MLAGKIGYFRASLDPAAAAYIAAVEAADGQALEAAVRTAINNFVVGCKADGIWSAIKASCVLMGARTLSGALVPLAGSAPTNTNFVTGDYSRKTGLVGNGSTKWLNANRNNNADPQNSKHFSVYVTTAATSGNTGTATAFPTYIGNGGGFTGGSQIGRFNSNSANLFSRNQNSANETITGAGSATGFIGSSRASSTGYAFRVSSSTSSQTRTSQTPRSGDTGVFRDPADNFTWVNGRIAFYSIGESLTLSLLDTRISDLYTAIGAAIP
jgi:hypothetical protein